MAKKSFTLWATLLSTSAARRLISDLVERGYAVEPAASSRRSIWDGEASTLLALTLETGAETATRTTVMGDVKAVLNDNGAMWHSLVVKGDTEGRSTWSESNIKLPPREEKKPDTAPEEPKNRFDVIDA